MAITHTKVSAVADGIDASLILPSDWNANHTIGDDSITSAMMATSSVDLATNTVTGILPTANGGTGIAFFTAAGPTVARIYTFPDAAATIARTDAANTFTGVQTFSTPIATASVAVMTATVGGGVPTPPNNTTTFLRGDGTFAAPAGGGTTLGTEQASTSGTSITFTGIPAGTKRIAIMFIGVSVSGTSRPIVRLGDAGGPETSGYVTVSVTLISNTTNEVSSTDGFHLSGAAATNLYSGQMILNLENAATFTWAASHVMALTGNVGVVAGGGTKSLSAELDRVIVTTVNGTDTFDAGLINISYSS